LGGLFVCLLLLLLDRILDSMKEIGTNFLPRIITSISQHFGITFTQTLFMFKLSTKICHTTMFCICKYPVINLTFILV
jgi:hypothetical protein